MTYLILCQENPEAGKVWLIERTGAVLGRGPRVIYDLVARWQNTREIIVHDPANRGHGSPIFVFRPKGLHPAVIDWLKARIESSLKAGRTVRVPWLAHLNTGHVSKMSWHLNGHRGLSTLAKGRWSLFCTPSLRMGGFAASALMVR
jgi:hypothetical protein